MPFPFPFSTTLLCSRRQQGIGHSLRHPNECGAVITQASGIALNKRVSSLHMGQLIIAIDDD